MHTDDFQPAPYQRWRCLYRVIATHDLDISEPAFGDLVTREACEATSKIIARIEDAIGIYQKWLERGAWQYDANKHIGLIQALQHEQAIYHRQTTDLVAKRRAA